jgi:hypothetical protein
MKCLALAIFAGTLIAESANACCPGGPSVPQALPTPHLPRPSSVSINPSVPGVDAAKSAVRDAVDFVHTKAKVRAKNPNATEEQVEAGTKTVIKRRRDEEENKRIHQESKQAQDAFMKDLEKRRVEDLLERDYSKIRNNFRMQDLEELRLAKERNTSRPDEDKIVGPMPAGFITFSTAMSGGDARRADIDAIVLQPGFMWVKK